MAVNPNTVKPGLEGKLKAGDIILHSGDRWLSKRIQFFMKRYRKKLGLPYKDVKIYNHTATVIMVNNVLHVVEALGKGITIRKLSNSYAHIKKHCKFITPRKAYNPMERRYISENGMALAFSPTRYDILNFFHHMIKIEKTKEGVPGKWVGPTGKKAKKVLYCSETSATLAEGIRKGTFPTPWGQNPLDIELNDNYKEVLV